MLLDELVDVIETLKKRIQEHEKALRPYETRTRVALIDPLLTTLGWDVSDPALVTPEYNAGNGRADYALMGTNGHPAALIEAKHLSEPLETSNHQEQVFTYSLVQQVKYAGLTDGDRWILDDVSVFSGDRRILDVSIANMTAHEAALRMLLLWRPNLGSGKPIPGSASIFEEPANNPAQSIQETTTASVLSPVTMVEPGWVSLAAFSPPSGGIPPTLISPNPPMRR